MTDNTKKYIKNTLKLFVSLGALAFVFSKIDVGRTWSVMRQAHLGWLLLALLAYVVSQVVSSERVRGMIRAARVDISRGVNLRLYWLGMFYNFFLPGGIGGDGYKVYWLRKRFNAEIRPTVVALLGDRLSGLVAISSYTVAYFALRPGLAHLLGLSPDVSPAVALILIPAALFFFWLFFYIFQANLCRASLFAVLRSFVVQGLQMLAASVILIALGLCARDAIGDYLFLFLLSSIASAVPVTLGGIGAREVAFVIGSRVLGTDQDIAVSLSLLFYAVSLISSLPGGILALRTDLIDGSSVVPEPDSPPTFSEAIDQVELTDEDGNLISDNE